MLKNIMVGIIQQQLKQKKISKKTSTTRYYGILSIKLKPGKIEIIKDEVEQPEPLPGFEEAIELTDGAGNSVFPNNEWEVGDQIKGLGNGDSSGSK